MSFNYKKKCKRCKKEKHNRNFPKNYMSRDVCSLCIKKEIIEEAQAEGRAAI